MFSLAHGTNDAQKTMGIITLALVAHGNLPADSFDVPTWVIVSSATAIALGTYTGGWRIIRTMGSRIIKMDPAQGFSAQGAGAAVVLAASHLGYPLSTTHVISGGVMGAGAAKRLSAVRWGVAGNIAVAWVLTLPAAALIGALAYGISSVFGSGALGPLVVSLSILGVVLAFFGRRVARGPGPHGRRMTRRDRLGPALRARLGRRRSPASASRSPSRSLILGATRAADHRRADRASRGVGLRRAGRRGRLRLRRHRRLRHLRHRRPSSSRRAAAGCAHVIAFSTRAGEPAAIVPGRHVGR